jgi:hypothetical protein
MPRCDPVTRPVSVGGPTPPGSRTAGRAVEVIDRRFTEMLACRVLAGVWFAHNL